MQSCLICDDHPMIREALSSSIRMNWPNADISEAADFTEAWELAERLRPDLILCDLVTPGAAAIDGVARMLEAAPDSPLLVITATDDDATMLALFELGISGFLSKKSPGKLIEAAINLVLSGGKYVPGRVLELARQRPYIASRPVAPAAEGDPDSLTERQVMVLSHIALGQTDKEIARNLAISPATVKAHLIAVFSALGASSRAEAVAKAIGMGALKV